MKKLNLVYFLVGLLLTLVGIGKISNFDTHSILNQSMGYQLGAYIGIGLIPILGLSLLVYAIRRFQFIN